MKFKATVTITYEKEVDTQWYGNVSKEESLKLINQELNDETGYDVIINDFESKPFKVNVKEQSETCVQQQINALRVIQDWQQPLKIIAIVSRRLTK